MQLKFNAKILSAALDSVSVGGGDGFTLLVNPVKQNYGDKEVQMAYLTSSDGTKTAMASVFVKVEGLWEVATYYPAASFRAAVSSLAKVSDSIMISPKGAYFEVSDEKEQAVVKVELKENAKGLQLPSTNEGAVLVKMKKDDFLNAIRFGAYSATESTVANTDDVSFKVDVENKRLKVLSKRNVVMSKAESPVEDVQNNATSDEWYLVNYKFVQDLATKLKGDMVQIAFAPKFMVVQTATALFGAKRSEGTITAPLEKMLDNKAFDFSGKMEKKDFLLGTEVAMIAVKEKILSLETLENGTLLVSSEGNKAVVSQKEHEGQLPKKYFSIDVLKLALNGCGDTIHYFGEIKTPFIMFDGEENGVKYASMIAPISKKSEEQKKKD